MERQKIGAIVNIIFSYFPGMFLKGLNEATKTSESIQSSLQNMNPKLTE
jgi:hypothetical protein